MDNQPGFYYENEGYLATPKGRKSEVPASGKCGTFSPLKSCKISDGGGGHASKLFAAIRNGKIEDVQNILDQDSECISGSYGGLSPLHLVCCTKQLNILTLLLDRGAEMTSSYDSHGNSVLHIAVRDKWYDGIRKILHHGGSPDEMSLPPDESEGLRETPLHTAVKMGDISSTKLLLEHEPNLSIRDGNNNTVFHIAALKKNMTLLKLLFEQEDFEKYLESAEYDGYTVFHAALSGDAGINNEALILKVMIFIYRNHLNLDQPNMSGETPLIKACRLGLPKIVKFLLSNGANPKHITHEGESAIHIACASGCSKALNHLISTKLVGDLINATDNNGCPPLHYAVDSCSLECCTILFRNGEHLTNVYKNGKSNCKLVIEKLPFAQQLLREIFDSGVTLSDSPQHHQNFKVSFNYSVLMRSGKTQCSIISELVGTPLESLIKHPLLESFLSIKWYNIRRIFYTNVLYFFTYLVFHTCFIMITFGSEPKDWSKDETSLVLYQIFHAIFIVSIAVPGILLLFANFKKYLFQLETYTKIAFLTISAVSLGYVNEIVEEVEDGNLSTERMIGSLSVVLGWTELMLLLGRFPTLGTYILMFTKVGKSIVKLLLAFISLLIGFSLGFHIIFQKVIVFADYKLSFVKTLTMMTGGLIYRELVDKEGGAPSGFYCLLFMSFFLFMVTIIISNLLIGLAVNDIPELRRQGKIRKLVKQASYLIAFEALLSFVQKVQFFPKRLQSFLQSQLSIDSKLTVLPNKEFRKYKYLQTVPAEIIKEAIELGNCEAKEDFPMDFDEDINDQLKSFRIRYFSDYKNQKNKFHDISEVCLEIKRQLSSLNETTNDQISSLSAQLQRQNQNYQNILNQMAKNTS